MLKIKAQHEETRPLEKPMEPTLEMFEIHIDGQDDFILGMKVGLGDKEQVCWKRMGEEK